MTSGRSRGFFLSACSYWSVYNSLIKSLRQTRRFGFSSATAEYSTTKFGSARYLRLHVCLWWRPSAVHSIWLWAAGVCVLFRRTPLVRCWRDAGGFIGKLSAELRWLNRNTVQKDEHIRKARRFLSRWRRCWAFLLAECVSALSRSSSCPAQRSQFKLAATTHTTWEAVFDAEVPHVRSHQTHFTTCSDHRWTARCRRVLTAMKTIPRVELNLFKMPPR